MEIHVEQWLIHRWQKGNRYYVAELMQDLFGIWILKRTWGSIDTYRGHTKTLYTNNYDDAIKLLSNLENAVELEVILSLFRLALTLKRRL